MPGAFDRGGAGGPKLSQWRKASAESFTGFFAQRTDGAPADLPDGAQPDDGGDQDDTGAASSGADQSRPPLSPGAVSSSGDEGSVASRSPSAGRRSKSMTLSEVRLHRVNATRELLKWIVATKQVDSVTGGAIDSQRALAGALGYDPPASAPEPAPKRRAPAPAPAPTPDMAKKSTIFLAASAAAALVAVAVLAFKK
mmetsp:Transcript_49507/g.137200  ORF Transcript_49507/g.137200 Transcript_49507/m.137200 type:complete len:197 (+) Transcript_49507:120-710(+)